MGLSLIIMYDGKCQSVGWFLMPSPVHAICKSAVAVATAYGPNVSKGILAMEAEILRLEARVREVENELAVARGRVG